MKVIVGLGNPGKQYVHTPHNVGFEVIERIAVRLECAVKRSLRFQVRAGKTVVNGELVWLVQPQAYMNNSGLALSPLLRAKGAGAPELIVAVDDADLTMGGLRVRAKGGSGGHKGLASIIASLGTEDFARVRIGIGRDPGGGGLFSVDERRQMDDVIGRAADAVLCMMESGVEEAMNTFNG